MKYITVRLPKQVDDDLLRISKITGISVTGLMIQACMNNVFEFFPKHK